MGIRFWRGPTAGLVALDAKLGGTIPIGVPHSDPGNIVVAGADTVVAGADAVVANGTGEVIYQATGSGLSVVNESGIATVPVEVGLQTSTYTEDTTTDFPNPERGWYIEGNNEQSTLYPITSGGDWSTRPLYAPVEAITDGRLAMKYVRLDNYRSGSLGSTYLADHAAELASFRNSGRKAVLRYGYGRGMVDDAPFSVVMGHISELASIWQDYADVIAVLQLGFIGHWGEWAWGTSSNNLLTGSDANGRYHFQILQAALDAAPNDMMVQIRYPNILGPNDAPNSNFPGFYTGSYLAAADRFTTIDQARTGLYNDCYNNNEYNGSWWNPWDGTTTEGDYAITDSVNPYTPMGGEACTASQYNGSAGSVTAMERTYIDYLNSNYNQDTIDLWNGATHPGGGTYLEYISKRLGYRLVLDSITLPTAVSAGASMTVSIDIKNEGFGKVFNPRPIDLVFVGSGGPFTVRMTSDARRDLPIGGQATTAEFTFNAPAGLVDGESYSLYLRLPDPNGTQEANNDYAIRLANTGIWDGATGRHNLGMGITASSASTPTTYSATGSSTADASELGGATTAVGTTTVRTAAAGDSYFAVVSPGTYGTNHKAYMPYNTDETLAFARFQLDVPKNATITRAEFTWWCSRYPSNALTSPADDMNVYCEQTDSAAQITDRTTLLSRYASVGSAITWAETITIGENQPHTTGDLKAIVQAVVNRTGWATNNYLGMFIYHGGGGTADATAWWLHAGTGTTSYHPMLYVEYSASSTLLGVGSSTDSLTTYPKIANTTAGDWFVDGSVGSSGDGTTLGTAFKTLAEGLAALTVGDTLLVKGGTYALGSGGIWRNTTWASTTRIMGYGTDRPILDATSVGADSSALTLSGSTNEIWHRFHIKNVPSAGGGFNGQSVRLVSSASSNTLSDLWVSHCITDGIYTYNANDNIIQDCAVWRLGDGVDTGTNAPDCYAIKGGSSGNALVRCFGAHGPDDVYDFWDANGNTVRDSVAYKGGYYWSGANGSSSSGDRMGFKMSGSNTTTPNHCYGSIAIACRSDGLQSNQQNLAFNYTRCTTVLNEGLGADFNGDSTGMTGTANDCISLNNTASGNQGATYSVYAGTYYNHSYNNWNLGISAPAFASPAAFDWSLGAGSPAIGAGITGGNLGASDVALEIAKEWLAKDLT